MSESKNPDVLAGDPADNPTDTRRRGSCVRWDDRRRRPGERRARSDRRAGEDRRKSERRLLVADRRVKDEPFPFPDRRKGEDRRKNADRRTQQRRSGERRKTPDRRGQEENPESGDGGKTPGRSPRPPVQLE